MNDLTWWLLQPSSLLLLTLILAAFLARLGARRLAGRTLGLLAIAWIALIAMPLDAWLAAPLETRHELPLTLPSDVDGILVLGGSVDWRASTERGQLALGEAGERVIAGAALAQRYPEATLAFTAVTPEALASDFREQPGVASFFFGPAFEDRRILVLPEAQSTYQEAILVLERLAPRTGSTWILVTSALHMPRAWATFATQGLTTVPYPVDPISAGARWGWPNPPGAADRLDRLDRVVREWGAVWVYRRSGRIDASVWNADPAPGALTDPTRSDAPRDVGSDSDGDAMDGASQAPNPEGVTPETTNGGSGIVPVAPP